MVESIGKKLHQARLQLGLTIDEVAHATKLRPDKIAALESDDYSRFANNTYAKGFLQIYGRFLKVDVNDFARTLDNSNPISISDYQYLSNAPVASRETLPTRSEGRRPPSLAPLFFFVLLLALGLAGLWIYRNYERIQAPAPHAAPGAADAIAPRGPNPDAAFVDDRISSDANALLSGVSPVVSHAGVATLTTSSAAPEIAATPPPADALPSAPADQDFVTSKPVVGTTSATPLAPPDGINEVLVAAVKKTWVTIRRDDPKAPPIFEDYVYPNARPLKLKGARIFIEARDPAAVQITKNGLPYAHQSSGVPIQ